jgi:hypothetical protein
MIPAYHHFAFPSPFKPLNSQRDVFMTTHALVRTFRSVFLIAFHAEVLLLASAAYSAESAPSHVVWDISGGWQVSFDSHDSMLECRHASSGVCLKGRLAFSAVDNGKQAVWSVRDARDGVTQRLALVDGNNDAQGYVALSGDATRLSLNVLHRPPLNYAGELQFTPEIHFGAHAFACRTHLSSETPVVQMASGPADSLLNDSLFDADRDMLLRLNGAKTAITTRDAQAGGSTEFQAELAASILKPESSAITIELLPDYYRSRYVPKYQLIDRKRCPKAPTGWMAWNIYFDSATENDNLAEARVGAQYLKPFGLEFWSIESWQENSPKLPVSNFHNLTMRASPEKFPHGMKWLADQIRELGLRPGIWTVSFGTGDEEFYKQHRDWFLHDAKGQPMMNWNGRFVLDPSQAAVRKFTEDTHRTMSAEWGYEFFKTDGMSGRNQGYSAHFFERPEVRAAFREPCDNPYGLWIEALRRGIGPDRVLLACQGHYTGPEVAWADASRIGGDIVHCPDPPDWACYLHQARATQSQLFVNNILWYNDPDTLMVGDFASMDVARLATTVVALPGQLTFFGDKLTKLSPERMRLLQQTLPVCDVRPLDLAPLDELKPVWDLKIRRPFASWDVVSLFNWSDQPTTLQVSFAQLGLDAAKEYLVRDFWSGEFLGPRKDLIELRLEPHSNRLLAVHAALDRPQYLATDRHVSQGGVELNNMAWNQERAELVCTFNLVEKDPLTATFHVPPSFAFAQATAEGATVEKTSAPSPSLLSVTLRRETPGEAKLRLAFQPSKSNP